MEMYLYVEVKLHPNVGWSVVEQPTFSHPYLNEKVETPFSWAGTALFTFLGGWFGSNGSKTALSLLCQPRGFPSDVSTYVKDECADMDGLPHSMSYVSLKELNDFEYSPLYKSALGDCFFKNIEEMNALGEPENVRIVFWFDDI